MFQNKKGFTLVEMLIVIAIIAILSSLVLVGIGRFRPGAYDAQRISDLQKVQSYLEIYYTKYRVYPTTVVIDWGALQGLLVTETGIDRVPNDPLYTLYNPSTGAGQPYFYCYSGDGQSYILGARLATDNHSTLNDDIDTTAGYTCTGGSCLDGDNGFCVK